MYRILRLALFLCFLFLLAGWAAADTFTPAGAARHIGEMATVEGKVSQVHYDARSGVTFINMGGRYPHHLFTGVIFRDYASQFQGVRQLEGQLVRISGRIKLYKGRPEIILRSSSQISVP